MEQCHIAARDFPSHFITRLRTETFRRMDINLADFRETGNPPPGSLLRVSGTFGGRSANDKLVSAREARELRGSGKYKRAYSREKTEIPTRGSARKFGPARIYLRIPDIQFLKQRWIKRTVRTRRTFSALLSEFYQIQRCIRI